MSRRTQRDRIENSDRARLSGWLREVADGSMSRREFLARATVVGASASSVATLLAACGSQAKSRPAAMSTTLPSSLKIFNWSMYTSPKVLKDFEAKFGVRCELSTYTSIDQLLKAVRSGKAFDVIFPTDSYVTMLANEHLLRPLDMSVIPNFATYVTQEPFKNPPYDPGTNGVHYCVPYMFGSTGFAVRLDKVPDPGDSWETLFDPKYRGEIAMLADARDVFDPALFSLGYSINTTSKSELDKATAKLIKQAPLVVKYDSSDTAGSITSGMSLTECWDGDVVVAMTKIGMAKIRYVLPKEGYTVWADGVCIPANSPSPYAAHLFLNFLLDPVNAAASANYIGYQPVVEAADPLIKSLVQRAMRPTADILARGTFATDLGSFTDAYDTAFAKVKAAQS